MILLYDVFIRTAALPCAVKAVVVPNDDGTYDIYVNSSLSGDEQLDAMQHELCHIKENHFENAEPIVLSELAAHRSEKERPVDHDICYQNGAIGRIL